MNAGPGSSGRATLEDVAARAGVSRATASRVLNGAGRTSEATRRAVAVAVEELGYAPHQAARSLAAHRSDTVALVVCEPAGQVFADPFFGQVVRGVAITLAPTRYQLTLLMVQGEEQRARALRHLVGGNADGALLVSARSDDPLPARLAADGVPCVLAGRPPAGVPVGYVDADNRGGARLAVRHLLDRRRRVIATVAGPPDMAAGADRLAGWRDALESAGFTDLAGLAEPAPFTREGGEGATRALLDRNPAIDAVFVASDLMALGALDALRARGRRVPGDVAVVGFDDSAPAASADPPLTTVRQPVDELGRALATALLDQLTAPRDRPVPPASVVLHTELVVRASS